MYKEIAIRTYNNRSSDNSLNMLNKYLDKGYTVKIATQCKDFIEYILQKEINKKCIIKY